MKLVITGALGHIGSRLIHTLPECFPDTQIIMIDNMMTQRFPSLFNLPALASYSFVEADVASCELEPIFEGSYAVVHLAAITDAAGSFGRASEVEENNYWATYRVAEACAKTGVRLIALSSTSVYGTQSDLVDETCSADELKPQSPYANTKLREEKLVCQLSAQQDLRAVCCRLGTIFGPSPGMRFHTAVNKFCWQAVMGKPVTVWNTAYDQKRPYLDLTDAARAIEFILRYDLFDGRVYNVLTLNATVRQIVDAIREFVPSLEVTFVDSEIMNQLSYEVSCERFKSQGFAFSGDLLRGIKNTIDMLSQANMMRLVS